MGFTENSQEMTNNRLLAHSLASIGEMVSVTDLEDRFTFVNQAFLDTYGYTREEVLGQHVSLVWSPNNPPDLHQEILDHTRAGGFKGELINRAKDGREFPISLTTSHVRDETGRVLGLVGIAQEMTERRRAEEALAASTRQLEALRALYNEITRELDLSTLLRLIHERVTALVGAVAGAVFLWDEADQVLIPRAWSGLGDWVAQVRLRPGEGLAGAVAQRREGMIDNEYRVSPYASPILLERSRVVAILAEPLLYRDRLVGVITVHHEEPGRHFTEADQSLVRLFADQAAIASSCFASPRASTRSSTSSALSGSCCAPTPRSRRSSTTCSASTASSWWWRGAWRTPSPRAPSSTRPSSATSTRTAHGATCF